MVDQRSVNWHQNAVQRGVAIFRQWQGSAHSIDHMVQQIVSAALDESRHEATEAELRTLRARVEAAPVGEVNEIGIDKDGNAQVCIGPTKDEMRKAAPLLFQRVRLVVEE